jgi:hypothetical protein
MVPPYGEAAELVEPPPAVELVELVELPRAARIAAASRA